MRQSVRASLGLGTAAAALLAASPAAAAPADFPARADAYLKSVYAAGEPGVAVVVMDDGKIVYSAGQGMADLAARRKITPGTMFRLGSITKQFTSAVVLQLVQEGKLALSDPLSKFLPDYPEPGAHATVAQLLNHTSGIKSYTGIPGWMIEKSARPITTAQLVAEFSSRPLDFAPGTKHSYNNSGYVLLGAIIEKVTGKPWHAAVEERISRPLGLTTIRYGELEGTMPDMAVGYSEEDGKFVPARKIHMSVPHAAGALLGTAEDLARWADALHKGRVLAPASYAAMIAPARLPDGKTVEYGFGIEQGKVRGRNTIGHGGGIFGFDTVSMYVPSEDLFVAVFANSDDPAIDPDVAMAKLAAMAMGDPFPEFARHAFTPAEVQPLLGVYRLEEGERRFFLKDARLFTRFSGGSDIEVFPAGNDRFFYGPASLSWFEVKRDAAGKHVMTMHREPSGEVETAVRAGPVPADAPVVSVERAVLERYVGTYRAEQGLARVALGADGVLTIQFGGGRPLRLLAESPTRFRADGGDTKIVFHPASGAVTHLIVHQGSREIRADRQPTAG